MCGVSLISALALLKILFAIRVDGRGGGKGRLHMTCIRKICIILLGHLCPPSRHSHTPALLPPFLNQATTWASRQGFTEAVREQFKVLLHDGDKSAKLTVAQEAWAGIIGGALSCWNHPFVSIHALFPVPVSLRACCLPIISFPSFCVLQTK